MYKNTNDKKNTLQFFVALFLMAILMPNCSYANSKYRAESILQQQLVTKKVSVNISNKPLKDILMSICSKAGISYTVRKDVSIDDNKKYSLNVNKVTVKDALDQLLAKTNFNYKIEGGLILITKRDKVQNLQSERGNKKKQIKGRVIDDSKQPLPGAMVLIKGTTKGAIANEKGDFILDAEIQDEIEVSFVGYKPTNIRITKDLNDILVVLKSEHIEVDDVVVVAYGEQKKESMVGSISSVNARQLKSSSSDLTTMLAGNVAGVIGWQTGGMPGALREEDMNTQFYIRGVTSFQGSSEPLILLNGVEISKLDLARINPEDIETFNVMKDASATAMYGARGANGVIYVTTKKGQSGNVYTSLSYETVVSMPTEDIDVVDPIRYMELYNKALTERDPNAVPKYSRTYINNTASGKYPYYVYPANNWYDQLFENMTINHRVTTNIRGGSDIVQYYASLNYNQDNGIIKTDQLNQFDVNIKNQSVNLTMNLNIDLTKDIKMVVNSFSTMDKYRGPEKDVKELYYLAFHASPVDFAMTYPGDDFYGWDHIRYGGSTSSYNPYAEIQKGYKEQMRYSTINKVDYIHNLSVITKGLEFRASASLSQEGYFVSSFTMPPFYYELKDYNHATGKHSLRPINPGEGSLVLNSTPSSAGSTASTRMSFDARLMHTGVWKDHRTSTTLVINTNERKQSSPKTLFQSYAQRNISLAGRISYGYKDKYFVEGSFGYNGSERFAKENRMGFFPSLGASWIVSKEKFMRPVDKILPYLKFRLSWGKVGNDGVIQTPRFVHLTEINEIEIPKVSNSQKSTEAAFIINSYANPAVTWEVSEQRNFGVDFKLFDKIEVNTDIYQEIRSNLLANRTTVPATLGLTQPSLDNIGVVNSRGIDVTFKYQHAFTKDFYAIINATFTYSKAKFTELEESASKPEYQRKVGKEISQQFGYYADGLFYDDNEIANSPFQGLCEAGDIKYKDTNNDGKIDTYDAVAIGYPTTPRMIYGFNAFFAYKNLELSFSFQGLGERSFFINPTQISPFDGNNAVLSAIANDHWSTDNRTNKPFWPRLSVNNIIKHNPQEDYYNANNAEARLSTYFMNSGKFLRCRSIELGYKLPYNLVKKAKLRSVRVYGRVNNPFIISSFNIWDVELGQSGFNYPIQRTYSLGLNVTF